MGSEVHQLYQVIDKTFLTRLRLGHTGDVTTGHELMRRGHKNLNALILRKRIKPYITFQPTDIDDEIIEKLEELDGTIVMEDQYSEEVIAPKGSSRKRGK